MTNTSDSLPLPGGWFSLASILLTIVAVGCNETSHDVAPRDRQHSDRSEDPRQTAALQELWRRVSNAGSLDQQQRQRLYEDTIAHLQESRPTRRRIDLAKAVVQLAHGGDDRRAAEAYRRIAAIVRYGEDETLLPEAITLEGYARRRLLLGETIEIAGETIDRKPFDLNAYHGKVVLIDFWATWCGYCIEELPNVLENYSRYHDRGFEVVGITGDTTREPVETFLQERNIPWVTLFDPQGAGHPMAIKYGVASFPTTFLVDSQGKVVSVNARGAELGRLLQSLLGPLSDRVPTDHAALDGEPGGPPSGSDVGPTLSADDAADPSVANAAPSALITNSIGMQFVRIAEGQFLMGSNESHDGHTNDQAPQHVVKMTKPFYLGVYEVTQRQFEQVMGNNPSHFAPGGAGRDDVRGELTQDFPVESVSWSAAAAFCNRLSELEKLDPCYPVAGVDASSQPGSGYRLPTEAEWEYACRAGTTSRWYFGENAADGERHAWLAGIADRHCHAVGQKEPNAWGLFDMCGNVGEWCQDWYGRDYYRHSPSDDPPGAAEGDHRVIRGGSWFNDAIAARSAAREHIHPSSHYNNFGFRVLIEKNVSATVSEILRGPDDSHQSSSR